MYICPMKWHSVFSGMVFLFLGCDNNNTTTDKNTPAMPATPVINYAVTATHPHDNSLFTEGLLVHNGQLFESTGSPDDLPATRSVIGITDLKTGQTTIKAELDRKQYFGEGIAICQGKLFQLTYKTKTGFIYNPVTFQKTGSFTYTNNEGWGLTSNGTELIMSDGTPTLSFLSPDNQQVIRRLAVTENNQPVNYLNELEYINGYIYANVWQTNTIVKINPANGQVAGKLDLSSLVSEQRFKNPAALELNGIAYDSAANKIYVTGKMWQHLYEINFTH